MKKNKIINYRLLLIIIGIGAVFCSCRKYPENVLWFKKPESVFKGGKLTAFTVDGADSIPLLNSSWGFDLKANAFKLYKPFHDNSWWDILGDFDGTVIFAGTKEIFFGITKKETNPSSPAPAYNPFLLHGNSEGKTDNRWDIIKITKKGVLKIRRKINGKTYEVQVN